MLCVMVTIIMGFALSPVQGQDRRSLFLKNHMIVISFVLCYLFHFVLHLLWGRIPPARWSANRLGHCTNVMGTKHSLYWRACNQNSQDKAWKHREHLKTEVIFFPFVLSKCSFSLAAQIFPPTSLNNLVFQENWNYHVLARKERPFMSFSNSLKQAVELGFEQLWGILFLHNVQVMLMCHTRTAVFLADSFMFQDNLSDMLKNRRSFTLIKQHDFWVRHSGKESHSSCSALWSSAGHLWKQQQSWGTYNTFANVHSANCRLTGCWAGIRRQLS